VRRVEIPIIVDARFSRKGNIAPLKLTVKNDVTRLNIWFGVKVDEAVLIVEDITAQKKTRYHAYDVKEFQCTCYVEGNKAKKYSVNLIYYLSKTLWVLHTVEVVNKMD